VVTPSAPRRAASAERLRCAAMSISAAFDTSGLTAYVNGEYVELAQASVSIFDHGFLYGDGVFEGMRVFDGGLFRPRDHLARLGRSARTIGLTVPVDPEALLEIVGEVVRRGGLRDAHVRPIVTRGFGGPGIDPRLCPAPGLIVSAYPFPPFLGPDPIRLFTSAIVRKAPRSLGAHVKSLNYLDAIVAKQQAGALGVDDAVMLDSLGAVAECTGANLFLVAGERLVTPTTRAALPGITRRTVLEIAAEQGIEVEEREVWPMELHCADGAFVTGSGAGIVPIGSFDGRPVAQPEHPLIARIQDAYRELTRSSGHRVELYLGPS
jgi:branched-chain amino acid aminotransferase